VAPSTDSHACVAAAVGFAWWSNRGQSQGSKL